MISLNEQAGHATGSVLFRVGYIKKERLRSMKKGVPMQSIRAVTLSLLMSVFVGNVYADDRPDHFSGKASETLEQASSNFSEGNRRLAEILSKEEISMADMASIHKLTYTLENALERIEEEYDQLAAQLEALHLASEGADIGLARKLGDTYLESAEPFKD